MDNPVWIMRQYDMQKAQDMAERLGISTTAAILMQQRGCFSEEQGRRFLSPCWEELTPPHYIKDVTEATEVILEAVRAGHPIVIYGDYDVDGVCSTVILKECLEMLGAEVDYYIPDRFQEGYGLNLEAVRHLARQGFAVLITVDCGIRSVEEVALARALGLQVIITDHHVPGPILPEANAIVNPQMDGNSPNCRKLCGAGVAYQLARALGGPAEDGLWLDLVSLATVADIVDLTDDNRILVRHGLRCLSATSRPGLRALMELGSIKADESLSSWQIGFIIAPRLNAAGRLDHARLSVDLLYTREDQQALYLAERLNLLNDERKRIEEIILREASMKIAHQPALLERCVLVVDGQDWHHGVLGIVASKLSDEHHKPVILINWEGDIGRGSCRSIEGFDIHAALQACQSHLIQFGGHPMAAGLTVAKACFPDFEMDLQSWSLENSQPGAGQSKHYIDVELTPEEINAILWQEIQAMEPFGPGNPVPVFALKGVALEHAGMVGSAGQHFKARLQGADLGVIAFGRPQYADFDSRHYRADLSFQLDLNQFRGRTSLQLKVKEMRPSYKPQLELGHAPTPWLEQAVARLQEQQPVLLTVPTYRIWNKMNHNLGMWFCDSALHHLHGHLHTTRRQAAENALMGGKPGLFLLTSAYRLYCQHHGASLSDSYGIDLLARLEGAASNDTAGAENLNGVTDLLSAAYFINPREPLPKGRYVVYVNRPSTLRLWQGRAEPVFIEAGMSDLQQRRRMRMQFARSVDGYLITDGNACGVPIADSDGLWLADLPFSTMEINQLFWELGAKMNSPLGLVFELGQIEANYQYLKGLYPEADMLKTMYTALRSLKPEMLQGEATGICKVLSANAGIHLKPADLPPILHILIDLGLCQVKKKGSIMAIKLVPHVKISFNTVDSPYYLEGLAEKKALRELTNSLQLILPG